MTFPGPSHAIPRESYRAHDVPPPRANYPASSSDEENAPHLPDTIQTGGGVKRKSKTQNQKTGKKRKPGENIQGESEVPSDKCKTKTKHIDSQYSYDTSTQNDESNGGTFSDNTANYDSSEDDLFQDVPTSPPSTPTWTFVRPKDIQAFWGQGGVVRFPRRIARRDKYQRRFSLPPNCAGGVTNVDSKWYGRARLREAGPRLGSAKRTDSFPPGQWWRDFDISYILERIEQILNSNQNFFLNPGFTIRFHHVVNPAGGRARKFDGVPAALATSFKWHSQNFLKLLASQN